MQYIVLIKFQALSNKIKQIRKLKKIYKKKVMMFKHICEYTKNHWIIHFKLVNCMICELYLNKALQKDGKGRKIDVQ